jgi:hypothetical protein
MTELLIWIESHQTWIYVVLVLVGLFYLRQALGWFGEMKRTVFNLERERAVAGMRQAAAMLVLVVALIVGAFILANFVGPAVPLSARPTVFPTVSLLATGNPAESETGEFVAASPLPVGTSDGSGCLNSQATLRTPQAGEILSEVMDIEGTADIENFAFYKYEFRPAGSDQDWQTVSAGTVPVVDDLLGTWDTSLVPAGEYAFRLVVTDTSGNAPLPCEIQVRIVPSESG